MSNNSSDRPSLPTLRPEFRRAGEFFIGTIVGFLGAKAIRSLYAPNDGSDTPLKNSDEDEDTPEILNTTAPLHLREMLTHQSESFMNGMFVKNTSLNDEERARILVLVKSLQTVRERFLILNVYMPEINTMNLGEGDYGQIDKQLEELRILLASQGFSVDSTLSESLMNVTDPEDNWNATVGFINSARMRITSSGQGMTLPPDISSIDIFRRDIFEIHEVEALLRNTRTAQIVEGPRKKKITTALLDPSDSSAEMRYSVIYAVVRRKDECEQ
ncbi:MAG: hypothetical protein WBB39_00440 [Candidatus Saccharimonadales bacterium]